MAQHDFLSDHHITVGLVPVADAFDGGKASDIISLEHYRRATFLVVTGAIEDAGISNLITVSACTTASGGTTTSMAFKHRLMNWSATVDTWGALTAAASTGYNFAAASPVANAVWMVEVTADEVQAAYNGASFVRLNIAETANKTVTATVIVILSEPRYPGAVPVSAIA
jgi:hypothetical protein